MQVFRGSAFRVQELMLLNSEPLNTEHSKCLLIPIPNRNCLTHLVKQSACKELMTLLKGCFSTFLTSLLRPCFFIKSSSNSFLSLLNMAFVLINTPYLHYSIQLQSWLFNLYGFVKSPSVPPWRDCASSSPC